MDDSLRENILFSAIALISEMGYETVSMRMIAQRAGCNPPAIYRHFSSKEEIMLATREYIEQSFELLRLLPGQVEKLLRQETPAQILRRYFMSYRTIPHQLRMQLIRIMYLELYDNENIREMAYYTLASEPERTLYGLMSALERCGAIPKADYAAISYVWIRCAEMFGFSGVQFYMNQENESYGSMLTFLTRCAIAGIPPAKTTVPFSTSQESSRFERSQAPEADARDKLVAAAYQLLYRYGSHRITMRMVSEAAGIQSGSAYNYFRSKDEVRMAVMQLMFAERDGFLFDKEVLKAAIRSGDADRIARVLARSNLRIRDKRQLMEIRILFREQFHSPDVRDQYWRQTQHNLNALTGALEELSQEGSIPPCDSRKLATLYVYTMASIEAGCSMYEEELESVERRRQQAGEWILGLLLNGVPPG